MNIISCHQCGVVLDKERLKFDEWEDGEVVPDTADWDGGDYLPTAPCPVCHSRIVREEK